ncbi:MAG TPA: hypothetical protein VEY50_08960 [Lysobacter sp.]|nr:hypothetical protein [Lysobacter sp.]
MLLATLALFLAAPPLLVALTLRRMAHAVRGEARFPPQAWKTLRDVRVLRGAEALRWAARIDRAAALAFALAAIVLVCAAAAWWRFG